MRKSLLWLFVLAVVCSGTGMAQKPEEHAPPNVLLIVREDIKPGMMPAHNKHAATFATMFGKLQTPNHRIALLPVAGSENEVIYLTGADNFAELEKINKDTDSKMEKVSTSNQAELDRLAKEAPSLHAGMRDLLAVYRPELSYGPNINIATMRYMAVTTVRVRPGQEDNYIQYLKTVLNVAREKAKAELHVAAFQVIAGSPATTFMVFRPMKSLAEYDLRIAPKVREAMTDDQRKLADKTMVDSVMVSETSVYSMAPNMSYVSKEFAAADPTFWTPKPAVAVKPKPKKKVPQATAQTTQQ